MNMALDCPSFALGTFARDGDAPFFGTVMNDEVIPVSDVMTAARFRKEPTLFSLLQDWDRSLDVLCTSLSAGSYTRGIPLTHLCACAPLPEVGQIFCAGANYRKHVIEMVVALGAGPETEGMTEDERRTFAKALLARQMSESNPFIFLKSTSSIAGPCDDLVLPEYSNRMDWEIELGVVMGAPTYQVSRDDAAAHIAGYLLVNDLTARDQVFRKDPGAVGPDWLAAKGGLGFLPTGPYFVPRQFIADPQDLAMRLLVNGEVMQDDTTADMTFDIARQIEHISSYVRMRPGDLLCTGTPAGNGITRGRFLQPGDVMEAEIEGLGRQIVRCVKQTRE
jgi:2-keto-4-pentenoate hydratase/2-oxohepta-3-ene-1,7-dioic acid hydratase in catechol pathway